MKEIPKDSLLNQKMKDVAETLLDNQKKRENKHDFSLIEEQKEKVTEILIND